jgi:cysteine desulfurase family protein (TIGR01976 family)
MGALDTGFIRKQFPAFSEPSLETFAHFENAGGSYACGAVVDRLERFYQQTKVQPYYVFPPSHAAGEQMDAARVRMAAWMNVAPSEVHFGPSTSQNTYVLAQALRQHLKPGDEIIVTNQDHEANIGAWRRLEADGMVIREWKIDRDTADLEPDGLEALLNSRTRVVAFTHCSNVVGSINPVRQWTDRIHAAGAIAIVDGVSYCPHGLPDVPDLGADVYLFSLYKVYGPHLGVMFMREKLNAEWPNQGHYFNAGKPVARFTPAGPDHAQIAATNGVIDYFEAIYRHHHAGPANVREQAGAVRRLLRDRETELLQPLLDYLAAHPRVQLIGRRQASERAPTVAFTASKWGAGELAAQLSAEGLGVGAGDYYAQRLLTALGIDPAVGVLRASFVHYTTDHEVRRLIDALEKVL